MTDQSTATARVLLAQRQAECRHMHVQTRLVLDYRPYFEWTCRDCGKVWTGAR